MCKACQAYRKEFAEVQDLRQGAVEPDDFEIEVNYHPKKKARSKPKRGCPGNDYKEHVYVDVIKEHTYWAWDYVSQRRVIKRSKWTTYLCAGCEKRAPRGFRI